MKEVCKQRILVRVNHEGRVMSPMQRMKETCNVRLIELKKKLRRAWRRRSSPDFKPSSEETNDATYRRRSRTPPSETFSGDKEYSHKHKNKNPTHKGLRNNAMNKALNQVAKSPFHTKDRRCKPPSAISSTDLLPLQRSNGSNGARQPF